VSDQFSPQFCFTVCGEQAGRNCFDKANVDTEKGCCKQGFIQLRHRQMQEKEYNRVATNAVSMGKIIMPKTCFIIEMR